MIRKKRKKSGIVKTGNKLYETISGESMENMKVEHLKKVKKILMDTGNVMEIIMAIDDELIYQREKKLN